MRGGGRPKRLETCVPCLRSIYLTYFVVFNLISIHIFQALVRHKMGERVQGFDVVRIVIPLGYKVFILYAFSLTRFDFFLEPLTEQRKVTVYLWKIDQVLVVKGNLLGIES
jgi:hypothetical protein